MHCSWQDELSCLVGWEEPRGAGHLVTEEDVLIQPAQERFPPAGGHKQQDAVGLDQAEGEVDGAALPVHKDLPQDITSHQAQHSFLSN